MPKGQDPRFWLISGCGVELRRNAYSAAQFDALALTLHAMLFSKLPDCDLVARIVCIDGCSEISTASLKKFICQPLMILYVSLWGQAIERITKVYFDPDCFSPLGKKCGHPLMQCNYKVTFCMATLIFRFRSPFDYKTKEFCLWEVIKVKYMVRSVM